jgi:predicted Zn finger-like uncharacterized protein
MLLNCPHCATIYDVDSAVIGENGRSLRCARCETVWFATRSQELIFAAPLAPSSNQTPAGSTPEGSAAPSSASPERTSKDIAENLAIEDAPPLAPFAASTAPAPNTGEAPAAGEDIETFARRRAQEADARKSRLRAQFGPPTIIAILAVIISMMVAWRNPIVQNAPQLASFYAAIGLPVNLRELVFREVRTSYETRDGVPVLLVDGLIASTGRRPVQVPRIRFALRDRIGQEIYSWSAMPERSILEAGEILPFRSRLASPPTEGQDVVVRFFNQRDPTEGAH